MAVAVGEREEEVPVLSKMKIEGQRPVQFADSEASEFTSILKRIPF
jgi:hypothetical protein